MTDNKTPDNLLYYEVIPAGRIYQNTSGWIGAIKSKAHPDYTEDQFYEPRYTSHYKIHPTEADAFEHAKALERKFIDKQYRNSPDGQHMKALLDKQAQDKKQLKALELKLDKDARQGLHHFKKADDAAKRSKEYRQTAIYQLRACIKILAPTIWAARQHFKDNQSYGEWRQKNLEPLSDHDFATLARIGEHWALARPIVESCKSACVRNVWKKEVQPKVPAAVLTRANTTKRSETANVDGTSGDPGQETADCSDKDGSDPDTAERENAPNQQAKQPSGRIRRKSDGNGGSARVNSDAMVDKVFITTTTSRVLKDLKDLEERLDHGTLDSDVCAILREFLVTITNISQRLLQLVPTPRESHLREVKSDDKLTIN
jgi:hypothetical protein